LYKVIYNYFKKKEKQFLAQADHVISLTENARQEILSWGLKAVPISVIPTCVDLELFNPGRIIKQDQEILRTKLGINQNDFILLYLGSWGTWYLTNEMLSFFAKTKNRYPNTKLLIVSTDNIDLASYHLRHDVVVTRATRPQIPLYISIAQAAICFIKPTFSKKASSATKLGEILAMNIPVIVNKGWGDIDELIIKLKSKVPLINLDGLEHYTIIESNEFFTDHYSLSGGIRKYHTIYSKLLTDHEQF
jgi:glycosyltransferase involved in cell wall biosynthesis